MLADDSDEETPEDALDDDEGCGERYFDEAGRLVAPEVEGSTLLTALSGSTGITATALGGGPVGEEEEADEESAMLLMSCDICR